MVNEIFVILPTGLPHFRNIQTADIFPVNGIDAKSALHLTLTRIAGWRRFHASVVLGDILRTCFVDEAHDSSMESFRTSFPEPADDLPSSAGSRLNLGGGSGSSGWDRFSNSPRPPLQARHHLIFVSIRSAAASS